MADIYFDVDTALSEVPVNIMPLIDDGDFKSIEGAVAYNAAGMALYWHFVTTAGAYTLTAVTPTIGGNYDWTDQGAAGIYTIEIPASGGASINNDTEGFGWFTGVATGILPWRGPVCGFRAAAINNSLVDGTTIDVNVTAIAANAITATSIASDAITAAKIANGAIDAATFAADVDAEILSYIVDDATRIDASSLNTASVTTIPAILTDTAVIGNPIGASISADIQVIDGIVDSILVDTAEIGTAGAGLTNINLPNQTMDIVGDITGSLSGSVGSVTGTIGGLTAAALADFFDTDSGTTYGSAASGSVVKEIADNAGGSSLTAEDIADAVWDEAATGHTDAGKAGAQLWTDIDAILVDTAEIGTAGAGLTNINLPNQTMDIVGNITGNLSGSVGSVTGNVGGSVASVTAGVTLANDAITAAKFDESTAFPLTSSDSGSTAVARTGADSDTLETLSDQIDATASQTSVDDIPTNSELTTALAAADDAVLAAIAALNNISAADVNAQVVDALATDTYGESSGVPNATASLVAKIQWLATLARNKITQTSTTQTLRNDADDGDISTSTHSDSAGTYTRGEWS